MADPRGQRAITRERSKREAPQSAAAVTSEESRTARIAARAFERYEGRGGEDGRDMEDWLEAEREIDRASERPAES